MDAEEELKALLARAIEEFEEAKARIPAHSARPWQIEDLERAEEKVEGLRARIAELEGGE